MPQSLLLCSAPLVCVGSHVNLNPRCSSPYVSPLLHYSITPLLHGSILLQRQGSKSPRSDRAVFLDGSLNDDHSTHPCLGCAVLCLSQGWYWALPVPWPLSDRPYLVCTRIKTRQVNR
ncbi:hypothetical protein GGR50DRAFT_53451 [Xylaria sp. CBS 124048]|nr:hypothetical protein GGR50DRAFT_53451 [Xylaria sp. CBS 124048]